MTQLQDLHRIADCLHWSTTHIEEPETMSSREKRTKPCLRDSVGQFLRSGVSVRLAELRLFSAILRATYLGFLFNPDCVAEGEGFEPPVPFQVQQFSRLPVSTTHTSLRSSTLQRCGP
jgi:hypothetical protein